MEKFSEEQNANAIKFMQEYLSRWADGARFTPLRLRFTKEELEGECLHMARTYLSEKRCPGIFSYHIACHAVRYLMSQPLDGLWAQEEPEDEGKGEGKSGGAGPAKQKLLDGNLVSAALLSAIKHVFSKWVKGLPKLTQVPGEIEISFHAIKNTRRKMEDRHALCVDINSLFGLKDHPPQSFYGVFDGHVSVEAAEYASIHVLPNLVHHPDFRTNPESALRGAIDLTDKRFCQMDQKAGTTAVMALLREDMIHVAWVGDSQAMLFRKGEGIQLVDPHKPDREDERKRIEALGGLVIWLGAWRVNGNLSVSRSIGDGADKKFITAEAEVRSVKLDGTEDYLVVACDGVWDVLDNKEMAEEVYRHLTQGGTKQNLARGIVDAARREGSGDNMTVIVVYFDTFQLVDPKANAAKEQPKEESHTTEKSAKKDAGSDPSS